MSVESSFEDLWTSLLAEKSSDINKLPDDERAKINQLLAGNGWAAAAVGAMPPATSNQDSSSSWGTYEWVLEAEPAVRNLSHVTAVQHRLGWQEQCGVAPDEDRLRNGFARVLGEGFQFTIWHTVKP